MDFRRMNKYITNCEGLVEMDFRRMNMYMTKSEGLVEWILEE